MKPTYSPENNFLRVATATPKVLPTDVNFNIAQITDLYKQAAKKQTALVVFPELSITGYTIGDLVLSQDLLGSTINALGKLAKLTLNNKTAMIVGLPFAHGNGLYNCAAMLAQGEVKGIVPKRNLPTYKEFYEKRWFQTWPGDNVMVEVNGRQVPFGSPLFKVGKALVGIEICEDLWVADQPSINLCARGAKVICNPSASPETVTKGDFRRELVNNTASRLNAAYVYSGADPSESTMDIVMAGHALISEAGRQLVERLPFEDSAPRLTYGDIDLDHLQTDRRRDTNYKNINPGLVVDCGDIAPITKLLNLPPRMPFVPTENARLEEIFTIQAFGLKKRVEAAHIKKLVLGLSGGLDSTLALLVATKTASLMGVKPGSLILTLTMPGEASSKRTQSNAVKLAQALGIENREIPIANLSNDQMEAIGHDLNVEDVTYENTQARLRTALLFNTANDVGGMVLGTGDLSEIALGWSTYNGDHMSGYNPNASIPKTLVRHLVRFAAERLDNLEAKKILEDILDTPISPELTGQGQLTQKTEDLIGPYELHDFFLYHFIRWLSPPEKIAYLAEQVFVGSYTSDEIKKWLTVFLKRFVSNQWKRSVAPDGPKVGSVSLSPRGDWRMPSDVSDSSLFDFTD